MNRDTAHTAHILYIISREASKSDIFGLREREYV